MKGRKLIILIIILIVVSLIFIGSSLSKYIFGFKETRVFESADFYFESDIDDNNNIYNINWDSEDDEKISFDVNNYFNNLLYTTEDIRYNITYRVISGNANDIYIFLEDADDNALENRTFTLEGGKLSSDFFKLVVRAKRNLDVGNRYSIELAIKSVAPYVKEMKITLNITTYVLDDYEGSIFDFNDYVYYKIQIFNRLNQDLEIEFNNNNYIVDMSSELIKSVVPVVGRDGISVVYLDKDKLEEGEAYRITFIKKVLGNFEDGDIVLK